MHRVEESHATGRAGPHLPHAILQARALGQVRRSGIDAVGDVPWGTHFCQFYQTAEELLEILLPYFRQGLQDNEYCMWVTSEPVGVDDAMSALRRGVPDLDRRLRDGQIEVLDCRDWYLIDGRFDAQRVLQGWLARERTALAKGYAGLRVSGNLTWLDADTWRAFSDYEATVNRVAGAHRVLAICTYSVDRCGAFEVFDVVAHHEFALVKQPGRPWDVIESPEHRQTAESLRESEWRQRAILDTIPDPAWLKDEQGRFLAVNAAWCRFFDRTANDVLGRTGFELFPENVAERLHEQDCDIMRTRNPLRCEEWLRAADGTPSCFETIKVPLCNSDGEVVGTTGLARDITERKRAEEAVKDFQFRLRAVADNTYDWEYWRDEDGRFIYCSPSCQRITGHVSDEFLANPRLLEDIVHPQDRDELSRHCHERFQDGKSQTIEYRVRTTDGAWRWVEHMCQPVIDSLGRFRGRRASNRDVTDRKRAEETLRQSEERLKRILNTPLVAIGIGDVAGRITEVNDAFVRLFGYSRRELLSGTATWTSLTAPEYAELDRRSIAELEATGTFGPHEKVKIRKDGTRVPVLVGAARLPGPANEHVAFVIDITDRKRAEQEKLEMERRLLHAQKLESLGILAGGIAHDFNNILAGIMGYVDLARLRLPDSEPVREDLEIIKKATQRAADLTRQMLAYSGKGKLVVEPVDLSRIVDDAKKMLAVSVSKKATLKYVLAADLPAIQADATQLHQIILNLVINASEALGEDNGAIAVSTDALQLTAADCAAMFGSHDLSEGLHVRLEVSDTGCGIDEETAAKIFAPFFTTKFAGRGLGLAAVHGIVRGHHGAIRLSSELGRGTTFQVFFPASGPPVSHQRSEPAAPWRGCGTVLVVDDEPLLRELARQNLERAGFAVVTANDGQQALALFRQHQREIVCVLLDLTMPSMNGAEALRELRKIDPGIRAILSSGYSEEGATERFADMRLAGFLPKPYQFDTMVATLRKALGDATAPTPPPRPPNRSAPPASASAAGVSHVSAGNEPAATPQQRGRTVLIADDDDLGRLSARAIFELAGFSVLTANDGEEALQVFRAHRDQIVCVFLDLTMPRKDGAEALRELRETGVNVHAIVSTGHGVDVSSERFAGLDVFAFVHKPEPIETVVAKLSEALGMP